MFDKILSNIMSITHNEITVYQLRLTPSFSSEVKVNERVIDELDFCLKISSLLRCQKHKRKFKNIWNGTLLV